MFMFMKVINTRIQLKQLREWISRDMLPKKLLKSYSYLNNYFISIASWKHIMFVYNTTTTDMYLNILIPNDILDFSLNNEIINWVKKITVIKVYFIQRVFNIESSAFLYECENEENMFSGGWVVTQIEYLPY